MSSQKLWELPIPLALPYRCHNLNQGRQVYVDELKTKPTIFWHFLNSLADILAKCRSYFVRGDLLQVDLMVRRAEVHANIRLALGSYPKFATVAKKRMSPCPLCCDFLFLEWFGWWYDDHGEGREMGLAEKVIPENEDCKKGKLLETWISDRFDRICGSYLGCIWLISIICAVAESLQGRFRLKARQSASSQPPSLLKPLN